MTGENPFRPKNKPRRTSFDQSAAPALRLLRLAPLERRAGGWRFGARRISDQVVDRLVERGKVASDGTRAWLVERPPQ